MILIIDDEQAIANNLAKFFIKKEYQVEKGYSLQDALNVLEDGKQVEVLITDLNLPDGSGLKVIEEVKKNYPDCIVIVLTGFVEESEKDIKEKGAHAIFQKPFLVKNIYQQLLELTKS